MMVSLRRELTDFSTGPLPVTELYEQATIEDLTYYMMQNANETRVLQEGAQVEDLLGLQDRLQKDVAEREDAKPRVEREETQLTAEDLEYASYLQRHKGARLALQGLLLMVLIPAYPLHLWFKYIGEGLDLRILLPLMMPLYNLGWLLLAALAKWVVIGRYRPGRHTMGSLYFVRWWFIDRMLAWMELLVGTENLKITLVARLWYRLMGAHLSPKCHVGGRLREMDLLRMDRFSGTETLSCASLEEGELRLGEVHL